MGFFKIFFSACCGALMEAAFAATVDNPVIWSDSPDPSIIRVKDAYYMVTTTMHFAPGVPIFKSSDLARWRTIGYVYETLIDNDNMNLNGGKDAYGKGSWASSIRYREKDGYYYVLTPSYTSGKTHLYRTKDIEGGAWEETLLPFFHDPSLFFDDDGTAWVFYGNSPVSYVQLNDDASGVKMGGKSGFVGGSEIEPVLGDSYIVKQEGSHMEKVNGEYYLFTISWPSGNGRTEVVYRSKDLLSGYTGRIFLQDNGVAQGGIFDTPEGKWYALLFRDSGPVGRISHLVPMIWNDGWPEPEGGIKKAPATLNLPREVEPGFGMVTSDDFDADELSLEWQWNHNPDNKNWSLSANPGNLRITTGRVDSRIVNAKNTLTQRTFGPRCVGRTLVDGTGMKDGDMAGLVALLDSKGFVALAKEGSGYKVVMYQGTKDGESLKESRDISGAKVYLRVDFDLPIDRGTASFYYSIDGKTWEKIGTSVSLAFDLHMFVGARFGLFNFATKTAGGYADFDWFKVGVDENDEIYLDAGKPIPQTPHNAGKTPWVIPGKIEMEDFDDPGKGSGGDSYFDSDSENHSCTDLGKEAECSRYRDGTGVDIYKKGEKLVVGYNIRGEWLEYTVNVEKSGDYSMFAAVAASGEGGAFKLSMDGEDITEEISVPAASAGEDNFDDYNKVKANVWLEAGEHVLRFTVTGDWFDIDYINFVVGKNAPDDFPISGKNGSVEAIRQSQKGLADSFDEYEVFSLTGVFLSKVRTDFSGMAESIRGAGFARGLYLVRKVGDNKVRQVKVVF